MASLVIILLCVFAAILYGIIHDQFTARICVEYFTIGHPPIFDTDSPTLLAMGWGVVATWWVGLMLGVGLASAARMGSRPMVAPATLIRPIAWLFVLTGICAAVAGILGYGLARFGLVYLVGAMELAVPRERHALFVADIWAHGASYLVAALGGLFVIRRTWRRRKDPQVAPFASPRA